jgi:hypothetical protein
MKIFHYDKDANLMEKIVETAVPILLIVGLLFMNLSGLGVFKNCYSESCSHAGWVWHVVGLGLSFYGGYFFWRRATDRSTLDIGDGASLVITGILFTASFLSYSGFNWWFSVCQ